MVEIKLSSITFAALQWSQLNYTRELYLQNCETNRILLLYYFYVSIFTSSTAIRHSIVLVTITFQSFSQWLIFCEIQNHSLFLAAYLFKPSLRQWS